MPLTQKGGTLQSQTNETDCWIDQIQGKDVSHKQKEGQVQKEHE